MNEGWLRFLLPVSSLAVLVFLFFPGETTPALPQGEVSRDEGVVWRLGTPDGSSMEFAPSSRDEVAFRVGQDVPDKDFPGQHQASMGFNPLGEAEEKPYTITFDLDPGIQGPYELVLDLIYPIAVPDQIKLHVNARTGIFPVRPQYKSPIDSTDANAALLAKQRLAIPLDHSWLRPRANTVIIAPLGISRLEYDAITLRRAASRNPGNPRINATVLFVREGRELKEILELLVPFDEPFQSGQYRLHIGGEEFSGTLEATDVDFGILRKEVTVPAFAEATDARLNVTLDRKHMDIRQSLRPEKQWKIYVNPKVHNDVGFTDIQPHVNELDTRNTDTVLEILATYPFYTFNFETGWLVDNYLDSRTENDQREFFDWARKGKATLSAFYLNLLTGVSSGEELYRATYFAHRLHREHGTNFDFACLTDAPSHSWFLPTLLTDIGINAFANGSNQTRAPILQFSDLNEQSPFYWQGMNGERILMWYSRSYQQLGLLSGGMAGSPNMEHLRATIPQFLLRFQREDYVPDALMLYGAWVDNAAIPVDGLAPMIERWNSTYEYPKLLVTSDSEYFDYIDSTFRDRLPVHRGDAGAYWEDGVASTSKATKINRNTKEVLTAAETIASFGSLFDSRYRYPAERFRKAWDNVMFYDEHTWGALQSIQQPGRELVTRQWEIKENYALDANLTARNLLARSLNRLVQHVTVESDMVFAFNLQNWARSGPVEVEIDEGKYLVDLATNKPVPFDQLYEEDEYRRIRFLAERVPPMGYKGYGVRALKSEQKSAQSLNRAVSGTTIEGRYYRLVVDESTGAVRSLVDKEAARELIDKDAAYLLNQYLYVTGGQDSRILRNFHGRPEAELSIHTPTGGRLIENVKTPYGQRIVVETRAENTPTIRTEYVVYDKLKRVDIHNELAKEPVRSKEAVYFAFPFAAKEPRFSYQIQNGWVRPNEDQLPGAAREWFATQNLVHVRDGDFSVAWASPDAPLVTLTDINRGKWLTHLDIDNGHVFSYVMNNYWFTNYKASQGGEFSFSYSLTSGSGMSLEDLGQFDADSRAPVLPYNLASSFSASVEHADRPLSPAAASLMTAAAPNTQMVVLKAAEDGEGYILRFRETAGRSGSVELKFPTLRIRKAHLCNGVEVPQKELEHTDSSITVPYTANSYTTVRLDAEAALADRR